jgi:predicted dehydrogenase/nucleoside-diphosphate-sugar epimerase
MLITGATGFIGSRLATLALARCYSVRSLTRSNWAGAPDVPASQRHFGSLPESIPAEALHGADVVVHCAASTDNAERTAYAVNVEGTVRLSRLARRAGVRTFIFLSSQSAHPDARSAYGRSKYAAERALLDVDGLYVVILRPGLVAGPGSRGLFRRLVRTVESLPVVPLPGGGRQIVQPIHVDELCAAVFRCAETPPDPHHAILHLGMPEGVSLAEFLQAIAVARLGRRTTILPIPWWLVERAVSVAGALRIPFPVTRGNVEGLKAVRGMDTRADLARLGLTLRPLDRMVRDDRDPAQERAVRVLLIGAGRVGLVHALTLSRLHGVALCGVVDPRVGARRFLRGLGVTVPMYGTLEEAVARTTPDAAVVATPGATHLSLTRACLARGLAVLVEKPLAIRREELAGYEDLARTFPGGLVQAGYVMLRTPHVAACLDRLRAGDFGAVTGFEGLTLLSFAHAKTARWEVRRTVSGGGALINAGAHVLSMIRAAFGDPLAVEAASARVFSAEVEDSMVITFVYPGFSGRHYCSWSIEGYPRQENRLTVRTDRGWLILTGAMGVFVRKDGEIDVTHQLDFDVGFNIAPDYAGGGFSTELAELRDAVRSGCPAPVGVTEAIRVEHLLFDVYDAAEAVTAFGEDRCGGAGLPGGTPGPAGSARGAAPAVRRVLDLRDLPAIRAREALDRLIDDAQWAGYALTPAQMRGLPASRRAGERWRVTVPDFLVQSRLLSVGRGADVLRQMGPAGVVAGARAAARLLPGERGPTFWVAAMGLLAAGLREVPAGFRGTIMVHAYLTDLALSVGRLGTLDRMLATCRRRCPRARVGFHTNMAAEAVEAVRALTVAVDDVSVLTSPRAAKMAATLGALRAAAGRERLALTAEVGLAPVVVHCAAAEAPERWAHGADAVLIGFAAVPALVAQRRADLEREWTVAFPGLRLPEGVLS